MVQKAWLCCPTPARNGNYPHAVPVSPDGPNPNHDYEVVTRCDPDTDAQILIQYDVSVSPPAVVAMIDLTTGEAWTGDVTTLQSCGGASAESDPVLMCDGGVEFLRHIVKTNGEPTGVKFDTKLDGTLYTVVDEAGLKVGACAAEVVCEPDISSATADDLSLLRPGHSISVQKGNCCKIKVTTSAGAFIVAKTVTGYSTGNFKCPVSVSAVEVLEGTGALEDIIVTAQKIE